METQIINGNEVFKPKYKIAAKKSSAGLGLYAGEDIPKGKKIVEYFGRTISEKEEYTSNSKYLFEINSRRTIDGTDRKNIARYINHSCRPNAEALIPKDRVFIWSIKNIKKGEEITFDYGKEYWKEHIKPKGCKCIKCSSNL